MRAAGNRSQGPTDFIQVTKHVKSECCNFFVISATYKWIELDGLGSPDRVRYRASFGAKISKFMFEPKIGFVHLIFSSMKRTEKVDILAGMQQRQHFKNHNPGTNPGNIMESAFNCSTM